jgi:hypothetical protein
VHGAHANACSSRRIADAYLKVYPANSDAEASASSQAPFSEEMAWHMRLYAELQAKRGKKARACFFPTGAHLLLRVPPEVESAPPIDKLKVYDAIYAKQMLAIRSRSPS